jgi:D-beta-D-heptose 7-phosphate kinase/D-beta-D-heptose 1-phosphate adenosyltransferase
LATLSASTAAVATIGTAVGSLDDTRRQLTAGDKILAAGDVIAWADAARARGQRIVFTNGCFDLVHEGHVTFLNEAKALGDLLIVGVNDDDSVRSLKGAGRPVVELSGRLRLLAALSCVDQVVPFSGRSPTALIEMVRPDIFAKGGDYAGANLAEGELLRGLGVDIRILSYVEDRSTSRIIERVRGSA